MRRQVMIRQGCVDGFSDADPVITVFRGIPDAKPPVDELRWREPQPAEAWDGVLEAGDFAPMPMQPLPGSDEFYGREWQIDADTPMAEDCLYLNIWTPALRGCGSGSEIRTDSRCDGHGLPVMVWLYGGAFQTGSTCEKEFNGEQLARQGVFEAQVKAKKLTQETEESCRKLKEETEEACRRKTEETDESCREKTEETDEACCKKREETNESCRKQQEETKESCAKQRRETKEQCEYMVESARQKGEELAAVYEEKLQAEAEEIQSHMDAELQKANTRYQKIYAEMETMTSVLEKNRRIFEEAFAGIEKMREEMKRSASEVETFMKDPVKSIFPGEEKETAAEPGSEDTAEEAEEEDEIVENSAVIDFENEPDYLDDDNDEEEDEIPNRAHDEEDEEE